MRVWSILERKGDEVITTRPQASLRDSLATLCEYRIGALPVLDERECLVGILSERDILRECLRLVEQPEPAGEACTRRVSDAMTPTPITCRPEDTIVRVEGLMTQHRIRHLPVLDGGRLCGIVSIGDVVLASLVETEGENRALVGYIRAAPL